MNRTLFGMLNNDIPVYSYRLESEEIFAEIITFGAAIRKFGFLDGRQTNIVGSFDTLEDYIVDDTHQGAIIGRVANRIKNAEFTLDKKTYCLTKNDGENCLHGGCGFDRKVWQVLEYTDNSIMLFYYSQDGEEGFPGGLKVTVKYTLLGKSLVIDYRAIPEKKTPITLTNHAYFNLNGMGSDVLTHKVQIFADRYTETGKKRIPTGERPSVTGTVFDLRTPKVISDAVCENFTAYDHNFLLSPTEFANFLGEKLGLAAKVFSENVCLSVYTNMRDLQFCVADFLEGKPDFAGGVKKVGNGAFCLETQTEPNGVNLGIGIYDAGQIYKHTTAFKLEKI